MGKPSLCSVCKKHQLASIPRLGELSHQGYCLQCARDIAARSVESLAHHGAVEPALVDLLRELLDLERQELALEEQQDRAEQARLLAEEAFAIARDFDRLVAGGP